MKRHPIDSLEFKDFTFAYDNDEPLFENINFSFPMGEAVRIQTVAGQGASTVLQILSGLRQGVGGFLINGENVNELSFEEFLPYRLSIGYAFDFGGLLNNKTLFDNLLMPIQYHGAMDLKEASVWVDKLLSSLEVDQYKDKRPAMVTGGVRKVVCLLRSLVLKPDLLILDDPIPGLKPEQRDQFIELIKELRGQGCLRNIYYVSQSDEFINSMDGYDVWASRNEFHVVGQDKQAVGL